MKPAADLPPLPPPVQLDATALGRLRELDPDGSHGVVRRVLGAFETSLRRSLAQLQGEPHTLDARAVGALAHTLKSSSASVGALELAAACARTEARMRAGQTAQLREDVEQLARHGQQALAAVEAMLRT